MSIEERHLRFNTLEEGLAFARQTLNVYRKALRLKGCNGERLHHASLPQYRRGFIESCLVFRRFIREFGGFKHE